MILNLWYIYVFSIFVQYLSVYENKTIFFLASLSSYSYYTMAFQGGYNKFWSNTLKCQYLVWKLWCCLLDSLENGLICWRKQSKFFLNYGQYVFHGTTRQEGTPSHKNNLVCTIFATWKLFDWGVISDSW